MEIIDFNPHIIRRRLPVKAEAKATEDTESGSALAPGHGETIAKDDEGKPQLTSYLGDGSVDPEDKPDANSDSKREEQENQSRVVIDAPFQLPGWIPVEAAVNCSLPYTSYEIPIPLDLNMDFCIDVMMGQDTIVFMFVCAVHFTPMSLEADLGGATG